MERKQALPQVAERSPTESGFSELVAIIAASKPALARHFKGIFRNAVQWIPVAIEVTIEVTLDLWRR